MNKHIILISLVFLSFTCIAQPFLGLHVNSVGGGMHAGYQARLKPEIKSISANSILFTVGMNAFSLHADKTKIYYFTGGYVYSFADKNAFTISASAGTALHKYKDFIRYDDYESTKEEIVASQKFTMLYTIEMGKDWHIGRLFLNTGYNKGIFFGAGLKAFFN